MPTTQEIKELAKKTEIKTVYDFMEQKKELISQALPNTITSERLIGVLTMMIKSSPELVKCTQPSLIAAVIQTVQLGLEPGNIGHCHYVPFNNKQKDGTYRREVQFMLGYRGIVELVNRCAKATILSTEVVYDNDEFEYSLGLEPRLYHKPTDGERGTIKGVYCVAKNLVANEKVFVYLTREDIEKVRNASKAGKSEYSPWNTWPAEMAKKTAIKRICKLLPLSVNEQKKIETDETIKQTIDPNMTDVPDSTQWEDKAEDAELSDNQEAPTAEELAEADKELANDTDKADS